LDVIVDQLAERGGKLIAIAVKGDGFFPVDIVAVKPPFNICCILV
jgi:hypothetical protein